MMLSITFEGKNGPYNPSSFSHSYKLTSVLNSGKGNQWYGYNVAKIGPVKDEALYERSKKFYTSLASKQCDQWAADGDVSRPCLIREQYERVK